MIASLIMLVLMRDPPAVEQPQRIRVGELFGDTEAVPAADEYSRFVDTEAEAVVREAADVEVLRLKSERGAEFTTSLARSVDESLGGFSVAFHRTLRDPTLISRIRTMALRRDAYGRYAITKKCGGFQPKVVFRFRRGIAIVDVLLCFNCDELVVLKGAPTTMDSVSGSMGDAAAWLELARAALPDDRFLQQTKSSH